MAVVIIVVLVFSYQDMRINQKTGDTVRQIRTSITELNHLVFSYILYHEERPKQQFPFEHSVLTQLLASVQVRNPEQQRLLDSIRLCRRTLNAPGWWAANLHIENERSAAQRPLSFFLQFFLYDYSSIPSRTTVLINMVLFS
jgi:hypothetical protein